MLALILTSAALALTPQDICIPAELGPGTDKVRFDPADPPGYLAPVGLAEHRIVPLKGKYVDDRGRLYGFDDIQLHVTQKLADSGIPVADDFYHGTYTTVYMLINGIPTTYQVPDDPVAYKEAKAAAKRARKEMTPENLSENFQRSLCAYNQGVTVLRQAQAEQRRAADVATLLEPGVPASALAVAKSLYSALEMDPPGDPQQQAADANAVWAVVSESGDVAAAKEKAQAAKASNPQAATLAELLK